MDYAQLDADADAELMEMYGQSPETTNDSPSNGGTESEENPALEQEPVDAGTLETDTTLEKQEDTVPEHRYKAAVQAMGKAQEELAEYKKHESARESKIQQLEQQVQNLQQALQQQSTQQVESATQEQALDDDELNEALEMYPEVTKPLLKRNAQLEKELADMKAMIGDIRNEVGNVKNVTTRYEETEQSKALETFLSAVRNTHPDVDTIHQQPEFVSWYEQQTPMTQSLWDSDKPGDVINLLNLYRAGNPPVHGTRSNDAPQKDDKLARAREQAAPQVRGSQKHEQKRTWTTAEINKLTPEQYLKYEAEIDEAMARGEIM